MIQTVTAIPLAAWRGDATLRAETVRDLRDDLEAGRLRQGYDLLPNERTGYTGCLLGCLVAAYNRRLGQDPTARPGQKPYPTDANAFARIVSYTYGIPLDVVHLWDLIFEELPAADAPTFAYQAVAAIPVNADMASANLGILYQMIVDVDHGLLRRTPTGSELHTVLHTVADALAAERLHGNDNHHLTGILKRAHLRLRGMRPYTGDEAVVRAYELTASAAYWMLDRFINSSEYHLLTLIPRAVGNSSDDYMRWLAAQVIDASHTAQRILCDA